MAVVTVDGLCKRYPGAAAPAVQDVSFTVTDGEFMVLLGPSGCGKSTVLRMIAGLEPITSGTVSIDGRVVNQVPAKLRDIAMVFQSYALYPHMTVYDNLAFGLRRREIERVEIDRRVHAAAKKLGLAPFLKRKPHALSGGQRQRVALGRAIVRDPRVFLFDEPLSNLDAALRVTTRNELIKQQHDIGTTSIYVTHDQVEAMTMGHSICIMNEGKVVQIAVAHLAAGAVALPKRTAAALVRYIGRDVTIGVRPEDLYESAPAVGSVEVARLPARVVAIEPLGAETLLVVALDSSNEELIARVGRDTGLRSGDRFDIALDTAAIHLFDSATTKAIV